MHSGVTVMDGTDPAHGGYLGYKVQGDGLSSSSRHLLVVTTKRESEKAFPEGISCPSSHGCYM